MSNYVKINQNNELVSYPVSQEDIINDNPEITDLSEEGLRSAGYERAVEKDTSLFELSKFKIVVDTVERDDNLGIWVVTKKLVRRFETDEEQVIEEAKKWEEIRSARNQLLDNIDKALIRSQELVGQGITTEQNKYVIPSNRLQDVYAWKQGLRDITSFENPWGVIWPLVPEGIKI